MPDEVAIDVAAKWHVTTWRHVCAPHGDMYVRHMAHMCFRVCMCVRVRAQSVISGLSIH